MEHYAGIDVSLEQSSVCVVDATGRIVREAKVASEPEALVRFFGQLGLAVTRIGLEAGPLSQWLIWGIACQAELRFVSSPASFGIVGDRLAPTALERSYASGAGAAGQGGCISPGVSRSRPYTEAEPISHHPATRARQLKCGRIGDPDHDPPCCEGRGSERTDPSARRHTIAKPLRDHAHLGLSGLGLTAVPMGGRGISLEWQLLRA